MKERETTGTADQRRSDRKVLEGPVKMRLETATLEGQGDNISRAGLLFYTEQPVRVEIVVNESSGPRTMHGRLIRLNRIGEATFGLAVEFDSE